MKCPYKNCRENIKVGEIIVAFSAQTPIVIRQCPHCRRQHAICLEPHLWKTVEITQIDVYPWTVDSVSEN